MDEPRNVVEESKAEQYVQRLAQEARAVGQEDREVPPHDGEEGTPGDCYVAHACSNRPRSRVQ